MKNTLTQSFSWLHTWAGLTFGWALFGILLAGSLAVFYQEIDVWAIPELAAKENTDRRENVNYALGYLRIVAPNSRLWRVILPSAREPILEVSYKDKKGSTVTRRLDPETGQVVTRDARGGYFYYRYHYQLLIDYNKNKIGLFIVAASGIIMLVASITGILIHKHIIKDFFTFRPSSSASRSWMDAHNVLGVLPLPFHIMMAYTGLMLYYWLYIPAAVNAVYGGDFINFRHDALGDRYQQLDVRPGPPAPLYPVYSLVENGERIMGPGSVASLYVRDPGHVNAITEVWRTRTDRVSQHFFKVTFNGVTGRQLRQHTDAEIIPAVRWQARLAALHWLEWGGPIVRWVYFFCGLAGAATTATGLVLFIKKREMRAGHATRFFKIVNKLNVASVAGFCIACASYMWLERLVPFELAERNDTIDTLFFSVWAMTFLHAFWRPSNCAWIEQIAFCGLSCLCIPLTGIPVHRDLLQTLQDHDWIRSSVDVTAMAIGVAMLGLAWHLSAKGRIRLTAAEPALKAI